VVAQSIEKSLAGDELSTATTLARSTVRQMIELGVQDVVLSPGSRNTPLSLALLHAENKGLITLHVRIDERGAAFFALGIAKATKRYVALVCTSGTAVANYLPAVLEAHHSDLNLLLVTADRPARLRKTGSNQTTNQVEIFGDFVRAHSDSAAPLDLTHFLDGNGPIHINLQFDEPLIPTEVENENEWLDGVHHQELPKKSHPAVEISITTSKNLLIVGHDRAGFDCASITKFAERVGAPIIAEDPLSFDHAIAHAPILLSDERVQKELKPETLFVIGRTTLSRSINSYIAAAPRVVLIDPRIESIDTERSAHEIHLQIPRIASQVVCDELWFENWQKYEALATQAIATLPEWCEGRALQTITKELPADTALFVASSRPIRDIESFAIPRKGLEIYANRGLAGIDGNVSTAMGIATFHEETVAVIGDLAFLHDLSALAQPTQDPLTLIVIDNDGGGIFSTLPQRGVAGFEKVFGTPHGQDLAKIVAGFGISYEVVSNTYELQVALRRVHPRLHIIIAKMPDRESNADAIAKVVSKYRELVAL
jgi:2-succinyl-5-enolpyruvyl-6-hydroxy-3-cyclohexene-1-carboxylate synthase